MTGTPDASAQTVGAAPFSFWAQLNVRFGAYTFREVPARLQEWGFRRPAAIVDAAVVSHPLCAEVLGKLKNECEAFELYPNAVSEPDYGYLDEVAAHFRDRQVDSLIAVGGGSTLDLVKGVSVLLTNPGRGLEYRGFGRVQHAGVPLVAVPTTAGSGSEVTPNAVFIERTEQRKFGINTPLYMPRLAVLDPVLTLSCPRGVTVSSGMDALVHAIEAYVAKAATPMSRVYSREAFRLVFNRLGHAVASPEDLAHRAAVLLGAHCAGLGLMNSGAGPAGAMSYPLGVHFKVPHGLAGAVFLAPVVAFNVRRGCDVYADLYDWIDGADAGLDRAEKARAFADRVSALCRAVGVPEHLAAFGVSPKDVPMLADQTMLLAPAVQQNPAPMTVAEITSCFETLV